jgi:hypothetical protein
LGTRVSPELAQRYRELAAEYGLSQSDFIAALLHIGARHLDELDPAPAINQEELPLNKAS